jgi:hypothetical protein
LWVVKMFRGSQINNYFSKIGARKGGTSESSSAVRLVDFASSSGEDLASCTIGLQTAPIDLSEGTPIVESQSTTAGSMSTQKPREYPSTDPRYVHHIARSVPLRSCEAPYSVCNQPRKRNRSNPAIKLITPERLGVPWGIDVVDVSVPSKNGPITELSSDEGDGVELCQDQNEEELDPDVQEWLQAQKKKKVMSTSLFYNLNHS